MDFSVEVDKQQTFPVVRVKGEVDIYTCPKLNKILMDIISSGENSFVIDLEGTRYLDSTGLGTIAYAARSLQEKEGRINVICTHQRIRKIFDVSGLGKKNIQIFDREEDAIVDLN